MVDPWAPRSSQIRLRVEDGMVTIEICGVLDAQAAITARSEFQLISGIAQEITVDLRAVRELQADAGLEELLGEFRDECWTSRCGLRVRAAHPQTLAALPSWGIDIDNGRYQCRTRSTGAR